jgi:hypothetical protein
MLSYARSLAPGIKWTANLRYASSPDRPKAEAERNDAAVGANLRVAF